MLGIEALVYGGDGIEPPGPRRPGRRDPGIAIHRLLGLERLGRFRRARRQGNYLVVCRVADGIRRRIGVIRRALAGGPLTEHAAQPQEDEYCQRQEDDGVNVEHVYAFAAAAVRAAAPVELNPVLPYRRRIYNVGNWRSCSRVSA